MAGPAGDWWKRNWPAVKETSELHSKSNWTRPVAFGVTGLAGGEHVRDGSADV